MSLFEKGRAKTGGRRKGVKDRIGTMFLEELAKDFEEHGELSCRQVPSAHPPRFCSVTTVAPKATRAAIVIATSLPDK
jgi:hypothetical protein